MSSFHKKHRSTQVLTVVVVLFIAATIPLLLTQTHQEQELRQFAQTGTHGNTSTVCNVKIAIDDSNACPRLSNTSCTALKSGATNNISSYTAHVNLSSTDGQAHSVVISYYASVCQKGFGSGNPCNCYAASPNNPTTQTVNVPGTGTATFDITRSSGQSSCGTYQYDVDIKSVGGDTSCTTINKSTGAAVWAYCETGQDCAQPINQNNATVVAIQNNQFTPQTQTIMQGQNVEWANEDTAPHTVVADNNTFSSPQMLAGESFTQTFATPGQFPYHEQSNQSMKGTIIVTGQNAPSTQPSPAPSSMFVTPTVFCLGHGSCSPSTVPSQLPSNIPSLASSPALSTIPSISTTQPSTQPPANQNHRNGTITSLIQQLLTLIAQILRLIRQLL